MSEVDKVRALYGDLIPDADGKYLIPVETIELYLDVTNDNVLRAAALAVRAIAVDEILLKAYLKTDDLTIDGVKGAAELRLMAKDFESRAREQELYADGEYDVQFVFHEANLARVPEGTGRWFDCR